MPATEGKEGQRGALGRDSENYFFLIKETLFPEKPGAAFLTAGKSVLFTTELSGMCGWKGAYAALRNAELLTI